MLGRLNEILLYAVESVDGDERRKS
jgi:hypothetical protein